MMMGGVGFLKGDCVSHRNYKNVNIEMLLLQITILFSCTQVNLMAEAISTKVAPITPLRTMIRGIVGQTVWIGIGYQHNGSMGFSNNHFTMFTGIFFKCLRGRNKPPFPMDIR